MLGENGAQRSRRLGQQSPYVGDKALKMRGDGGLPIDRVRHGLERCLHDAAFPVCELGNL